MKNLVTVFICFLATMTFAQSDLTKPNLHQYQISPNSVIPTKHSHISYSPSADRTTESVCDTGIEIDYSTYDETIATNAGLDFNGSLEGTQWYGDEVTSYLDTFHQYENQYIYQAFDSLAFLDTYGNPFYVPLSASTIYVDSLGMLIGVSGDTTQMAHDSLVFSIYSITNTLNLVNTLVFSGNQLTQFWRQAGYLGYSQIGINQQFNQGEGFYIRMSYLPKDTSHHCSFVFTWADSCGPSYAAYLSPFVGYAGGGQITSAGTVSPYDNTYGYNIPGVPISCSYVYEQNWAFLPIIDVCTNYGTQIQASPTTSCPGATVTLNSIVYGTNSSNINYTWSSNAGTLTATSGSSTSIVMPDSGNVTVTVSVDDGVNTTTSTQVIANNLVSIKITNSNPVTLACNGTAVTIVTQVGGNSAGKSYSWSTGVSGTTNATISVNTPGTYTVTVTNSSGCSATASTIAQYAGGVNNMAVITPPSGNICQGKSVTFTNGSTETNNWTAQWLMGDPQDSHLYFTTNETYTYQHAGNFTVVLTMDSAGCSFNTTYLAHVLSENNNACLNGIEEVTFDNTISMIPNPSNGNVTITVNAVENNVTINVYNIIGSVVKSFSATDISSSFTKTFDFSNLASGTYLVKVQSAGNTAVKRLVITR